MDVELDEVEELEEELLELDVELLLLDELLLEEALLELEELLLEEVLLDELLLEEALLELEELLLVDALVEEELEDSMETFYGSIESGLSGKKVAIFGSYDWGDGEWLRLWRDRIAAAGATVVNGDGLAGHLSPDDETVAACEKLGKEA